MTETIAKFPAELLLETMAEGVLAIDAAGLIRVWNPAMTEISGYQSQEVLGQPISILHSPSCAQSDNLSDLMTEKVGREPTCIHGCECRLQRKDRTSIPVLMNVRVLRDEDGTPLGLLQTVTDCRPLERLRQEVAALTAEIQPEKLFQGMVGHSAKTQEFYRLITLAAESEATVLLLGASGTGKELSATAIHALGTRREKPFVRVNCGALSETLLESELFGHVKGAFTGAWHDRVGRFEAADGGTLFLDEIGEISPGMQVKLLRVLQEGEFERVGESGSRKIDVRVIAATNRDLEAEVERGHFRADLYYRLRVFPLTLPTLQERSNDIPLLAEHFIRRQAAKTGKKIDGISPEALQTLMQYSWPGNIRELQNAIEYAFVLCPHGRLLRNHLPPEIIHPKPPVADSAPAPQLPQPRRPDLSTRRTLRNPQKLRELIEACDWNKAEAARQLGVSRTALWNWMKRHDIPMQADTQTH
jgi:PAS domain S-box-containing protein